VSRPAALLELDGLHWALLLYCALNTLVAYGAFAEALAHWEASRVSAVLALTPLLCIGCVAVVHALWPEAIAAERVAAIGYAGAVLAVAGSTLVSLTGRPR
jgi:drug/metabolite transporter (DMT)-like permease